MSASAIMLALTLGWVAAAPERLLVLAAESGLAGLLRLVPKDPAFLGVVAGGAVVVALVVAGYQWFISVRDRAKSIPFLDMLKGAAGLAPVIADPAKRARLDDLRKKFEDGVEKFNAAGKDIYSLPWYLLVGPAGSGKTEAMRHCNVGFPPGLQDYLQGAGGTLNMHWWFTNHAVVLDTAGRMFMEDIAPGEGSEWEEFLKLLKRTRPHTPINGMLLVIGADSLIKDSAEDIESKAGRIARQLDTIQRTLDVRFPVYVIITKCDLIAGFREFFDTLRDPALQHQLLGWSNPAPLDQPLQPELIEEHMRTVRQRLERRRLGLILDPARGGGGSTSAAASRPIDDIDALYALPEQFERITPRLRRYLELIFSGGEWSPKPLFLRGIYFTSSMREGEALDHDLARALGVTLDKLPGGKVWEKERSFFLRDVFMAKAFKERGLVTRHPSVQRQQRHRRLLLAGTVSAATALVLALTIYGQQQLSRSVEAPRDFWAAVLRADRPVVRFEMPRWVYAGDRTDLPEPLAATPRGQLPAATGSRAATPVAVPLIFTPAAALAGSGSGFVAEQRAAHAAAFESGVLVPLVSAAQSRLTAEPAWGARATAALAELVRLQTFAAGAAPAAGVTGGPIDLERLAAYVLGDPALVPAADVRAWRDALDQTYAVAPGVNDPRFVWPPASLKASDPASIRAVRDALVRFAAAWDQRLASDEFAFGKLTRAAAILREFQSEEARLLNLRGLPGVAPLRTAAEFATFRSEVNERLAALTKHAAAVDGLLKDLSPGAPIPEADHLAKDLAALINGEFDQLSSQLPAAPAGADSAASPPASNTALAELRALIGQQRAALLARTDQAAAAAAQQVDPVAALLTPGTAGRERERLYTLRTALYQRAAAELDRPAPEPGEFDATLAALRTLQEDGAAASAALDNLARALPAGESREQTLAAAQAVAEAGRAARASTLLTRFYRALPAGRDEIVQQIARGQASTAPTRATVPMSGFETAITPRPEWDAQVVGPALAALVAADAARPGALDATELDALAEVRGRGLRDVARAFALHWTRDVLRDGTLRAGLEGWDEFSAAARAGKFDAADLNARLRANFAAAPANLDVLPPTVRQDPEVAAAAGQLEAQIRLLADDAVTRRTQESLDTLQPLFALDWKAARDALLAPGGAGTARVEALRALGAPESPAYWQSIASGLLRALRGEFEPQGQAALTTLRSGAKWPLAADAPRTNSLTIEDLTRIRDAARLLLASSSTAPAARGATEVERLLDDLRSGRLIDATQREQIERIAKGAEALAAAPIQLTLVPIWDSKEIAALPTTLSLGLATSGPASEWFEQLQVVRVDPAAPARPADSEESPVGERIGLRVIDARQAAELAQVLQSANPGPGLSLRFFRNFGDTSPAATAALPGPWPLMAALHSRGLRPDDAAATPGTAWLLPLTVDELAQGRTYHLWLRLTTDKPLLRPEEWPRLDQWPK